MRVGTPRARKGNAQGLAQALRLIVAGTRARAAHEARKVLARGNPLLRRVAVDLARGEEQETLDAGRLRVAEQAAQADHVGVDGLDRKAAVEGGRGNGRRMDDVVETLRKRHGGDIRAYELGRAAAIGGKTAGDNLATPGSGLPFDAAEVVASGIMAWAWGL